MTDSRDASLHSAGPVSPVTATELIHHEYRPPAGFDAVAPGVFKASTVIFPNVAALRARRWQSKQAYTYGLHGTPTTFTLEERLATLEGGRHTLLAPSGLAALTLVNMALLSQGDEVLLPDNAYGPNKEWVRGELARWGIAHRYYDPLDARGAAAMMSARTRLLWLEAAGSVTLEFPDLRGLTRAARERGVLVALDNTWGAGLAFNPFAYGEAADPASLGADISVHALTKYPSGGGDVLMGSVVTRDEKLHQQLKLTHMRMGYGVGVNDVEAVLRSLPSLPLRYAAHDRAARDLALWLAEREEVAQVLHPAVEDSPGHAHWLALCGRTGLAAGLFSIVLHERYGTESVDRFCDSLQLFRLGYSWGGPTSLVVPYDIGLMRDASVARWPHKGTLVRFSIGLEDVDDLRADLAQALARL